MPGIAGLVSLNNEPIIANFTSVIEIIDYVRPQKKEIFEDKRVCLGCVHIGAGDQFAIYRSERAVVAFFGYLTHPKIISETNPSPSCSAAKYIHDLYVRGEPLTNYPIYGAFAYAIWDKRSEELIISTDFLGLRPIYYTIYKGTLRFASEIKAILVDPSIPRKINKSAFSDLFYHEHLLEGKTLFENIYQLPPSTLLQVKDGKIFTTNYWEIKFPSKYPSKKPFQYDELISRAIETSINRMLRPELRYGLSLSGGLDSRWIAAYLSKYRPESLTFTVGIKGSDDTPIAQAVASTLNLKNTYIELTGHYIQELGEIYTYIVDGMDSLTSMDEFPLTINLGDNVDVSVGGLLGGGEFGYSINPLSAVISSKNAIKYFLWRAAKGRLPDSYMEKLFGTKQWQEMTYLAIGSASRCFDSKRFDKGYQVIQNFQILHHQIRPNRAQLAKLPFVDIYHPLADYDVVSAAINLPVDQLIIEKAYRKALATSFPDLENIPWTFTMAPLSISTKEAILRKVSQLTIGKWLYHKPMGQYPFFRRRRYLSDHFSWSRTVLRNFIEATIMSEELLSMGIFQYAGLQNILTDHFEGKIDATVFIGNALAIALWAKLFYLPSTPNRPKGLLEIGHRGSDQLH